LGPSYLGNGHREEPAGDAAIQCLHGLVDA
jgi:hypothetical protein